MVTWTATFELPSGYDDDPYDADELAEYLRQLADRVAAEDIPPTGDVWGKDGYLLARAQLVESDDA